MFVVVIGHKSYPQPGTQKYLFIFVLLGERERGWSGLFITVRRLNAGSFSPYRASRDMPYLLHIQLTMTSGYHYGDTLWSSATLSVPGIYKKVNGTSLYNQLYYLHVYVQ